MSVTDLADCAPRRWPMGSGSRWSGVSLGVFVYETAVGLFTLWLFSRGGWKKVRV
ncbi:MAG TPA: hypothetical protein VNK52_11655 [Hyphomicrobiaceae bacterium]|nr:hypothetical protein [Hyphomicrobiaceae bacterium]